MLKSAPNAIQEIKKQNVLVKVIESAPIDNQHWDFLLKQLLDPKHNRPVKKLKKSQKRDQIWDAAAQPAPRWVNRNPSSKRGAPKDTSFIKKTPTSLAPPDGKMQYFDQGNFDYVGIGFVINRDKETLIQIKDKYIFEGNIVSKNAPWLYDEDKHNFTQASPNLKATTLEALREKHKQSIIKGEVPQWNEILASPSRPSVEFLFVSVDRLSWRLNLITKQILVQKNLGVKLPLLIMGNEVTVKEYSLENQINDILEALARLKGKTASYQKSQHEDVEYRQKLKQLLSNIDYKLFLPLNLDSKNQNLIQKIGTLTLYLYENGYKKEAMDLLSPFINVPIQFQSEQLNKCLHTAVKANDNQMVSLLLSKGADVNYLIDKQSVLELAIDNKNKKIFDQLMKLNPSKDTLGSAFLSASELKSESDFLFFANLLLSSEQKCGLNWHWTGSNKTALHAAVAKKHYTSAKLICQHGGNVQKKATFDFANSYGKSNNEQLTPIDLAFRTKDYKMVEILLQNATELSSKELGIEVLNLLKHEQYGIAKKLLNSREVQFEGFGSDFKDIIHSIAKDNSLTELAKQTIALYFINKSFNETTTPVGLMNLISLLRRGSPEAKAFLFQPTKSGTSMFHYWHDENTCSFWSSIMKLAKNRMLEMIQNDQTIADNEEVSGFLKTKRYCGFWNTTTSFNISKEADTDKQLELIVNQQNKLGQQLQRDYGFAYKPMSSRSG